METNSAISNTSSADFSGIEWTGSKSDLIELVYALHKSKAINNGRLSLGDLQKKTEILFGLDLGHLPIKLRDISLRKHPTRFLDKLKTGLDDFWNSLMK